MRDPDEVWAELTEVRAALGAAEREERAALEARREALAAEAEAITAHQRRSELEAELADVEAELEALLDRHIGGARRKRGFFMGFLWGDHDSAVHMQELNRKMDEAGGRAALEARRTELRRLLGLDGAPPAGQST